jgi:hypothetical protein
MLAPWQADMPVEMSRADLDRRTGRTLSDGELDTLVALGIVHRAARGRLEVAVSQLSVGLALLDLGFPVEAAVAASEVYAEHGRQIAKELNELFRTMVWPVYKEAGASTETLRRVVESLKPLSIASLVAAYEHAMDETRREDIERRTR